MGGFAVANGAPDLGPSQVLGQPLWRFISGVKVRHLYELILSRVRQTQGILVLPFRCDAPTSRRFMEMAMTALPEGEVEFVTRLVRAEPRDTVSRLTSRGEPGQPMLAICSWCKRVRLEETEWVEVEEAVRRLALFHWDVLPHLTHGVCHVCYAAIMRALSASPGVPNHGTSRGQNDRT